jgi:hypothetical protein
MAGLNLSTAESIRSGGQHGPALVPGKADESRLYRRITGQEQPAMPLGGKLADSEISTLKAWIDSGAQWEGGALNAALPRAPEKPRTPGGRSKSPSGMRFRGRRMRAGMRIPSTGSSRRSFAKRTWRRPLQPTNAPSSGAHTWT